MSLPTAVFLDTSIFAGQQYNFTSIAINSFLPVAKHHGLKLILPDPTEREIRRQIRERSQEALKALEEARRRAPFLRKWKQFPASTTGFLVDWEVSRLATKEWETFASQFDVVRLGYEGIDVGRVMTWYDDVAAPFREGKKRKEFPDAFAIAILEKFAKQNACAVAVVSEDSDFQLACNRFPDLLYFRSLPRLTELLVIDPTKRDELRTVLEEDLSILADAVTAEAGQVEWYHQDEDVEVPRSKTISTNIKDIRIVAFGADECTLAFEAEIVAEHLLQWTVWTGYMDERHDYEEWTEQTHPVFGSAKVSLDPGSGAIRGVPFITINAHEIEVTEIPRSVR